MPFQVQVLNPNTKLPNRITAQGGDVATLTDDEFAQLSDTVFSDGAGPVFNCAALTPGTPITSLAVTYTSTVDHLGRISVNGTPLAAISAFATYSTNASSQPLRALLGGIGNAAAILSGSAAIGAPAPQPTQQLISITAITAITATGATLTITSVSPSAAFVTVSLSSLIALGIIPE